MATTTLGIAENAWLSAYIYFEGDIFSVECDRVLLEFVLPCVNICKRNGWISQFFFVRYRDPESHIRLRLYGPRDVLNSNVEAVLSSSVDAYFEKDRSHLQGYPETQSEKGARNALCLKYIPYEPELERYGGPKGILFAQRLFHCSSEAALSILGKCTAMEKPSRLGKALIAITILVFAFLRTRMTAAVFLREYGMNYLKNLAKDEQCRSAWFQSFREAHSRQSEHLNSYVNDVWEQLMTSELPSEEFGVYHSNVQELSEQFEVLVELGELIGGGSTLTDRDEALRMFLPSYIHMMDNRLGISPPEESYLCYLIYATLVQRRKPINDRVMSGSVS